MISIPSSWKFQLFETYAATYLHTFVFLEKHLRNTAQSIYMRIFFQRRACLEVWDLLWKPGNHPESLFMEYSYYVRVAIFATLCGQKGATRNDCIVFIRCFNHVSFSFYISNESGTMQHRFRLLSWAILWLDWVLSGAMCACVCV